jgi:homoserine O-acetyltransferase
MQTQLGQHFASMKFKIARGPIVLVLHGTSSSATGILTTDFAGQLFGPGQPLDAAKYYTASFGAG